MKHFPITTFTDEYYRPTKLTEDEVAWFDSIVNLAKLATGVKVDIIPFDHDLYSGKHRDALGCCTTTDPENMLGDGVDTYITIDCYFIHEKFEQVFKGRHSIERQTLEEVIAHEIAHLYVWRHGKKHTALTDEIYKKIVEVAA